MSMQRNLSGWHRQKPDHRDWHYVPLKKTVATLPPTVDLSANMGVQLNQDQLGSCGPNTADELVQYDQKVEGLPVVGASRLFIYYVTRALMGTTSSDSGVDNRTMMKAMAQYGFCAESLWPYDESQYTVQPPAAAYAAALPNRITSYAAVTVGLTPMQAAIADGFPILFGFDVFNGIMSDATAATGIVPDPSGSSIGGHDVSFCGYTSVPMPGVKPGNVWPANTFKFRNHWINEDGTPWGDQGFGYLSASYSTGANASDLWTLNSVPSAPMPLPVPPVVPPIVPPVVPPIVPPVPPAPVTGLTLAQVIAFLNSWFATMEAKNRLYAPLLKQVLAALEAALVQAFPAHSGRGAQRMTWEEWMKLIGGIMQDVGGAPPIAA